MPNDRPVGFFLTWVTYGTWLPGDCRGWVEYKNGWKLPNVNLEASCKRQMGELPVILSKQQRYSVEDQVAETCTHREWNLHAVNCRSNHLHAVVTATNTQPKKIRSDLKAYATRCLKTTDPARAKWWAERGSIRWIFTDKDLSVAVAYVMDGQDRNGDK